MRRFLCGSAILLYSTLNCFSQKQKELIIPLDSVFALAEQNSTYLKLSGSAIELSKSVENVVKNAHLPTADVSLSATYYGDAKIWNRDFSNGSTATIPNFGNDFSIQASYVIFSGGAISNSIKKAELETQVAILSHEKNITAIRFLVAGNYLDLFKLYNQKTVFEKNVEQANETLRQMKARLEAGMALDNDLTRYELLLQNLNLALIEIKNNISIVNEHLVTTLGLSDETSIIPDSTILDMEVQLNNDADYLLMAQNSRQDIKIKELNKEIAEKEIKLAKADLYPSLAIFGADVLNGPILVEVPPLDVNFNYYFVSLGLKYNLASLYKSKKNIKLAEAKRQTSDFAYQAELENTQTAVHAAYIKYSEAYDKLAAYQKNFELATENYAVINNRYNNDLVLITELLDASNMKLNAELQVVNSKLNIVYLYYNLLRETGTL